MCGMSILMKFLSDDIAAKLGVGLGVATAVTAAAASYYLLSQPEPFMPSIDFSNQSVLLKDGSRISHFVESEDKLLDFLYEDCRTLYDAFQRGLKLTHKHGPCLGRRTGPNKEYEWMTYQEVFDTSQQFGSGLLSLGLEPNPESFVGIFAQNRCEWVFTEQACNIYSMAVVPLYDTLEAHACEYIIQQTELSIVVCDTAARAEVILKKADKLPSLKFLVLIGDIAANIQELADKHNIKLYTFEQIQALGKEDLKEPVPPKPSDIFTICYTSGTTGLPKGAMMSHINMISCMSAVAYHAQIGNVILSPDHCHLSYLPLAHMFERCAQVMMFMHGARVGFYQGDVKLLLDDLEQLKPTIFPTVPRVLNRMYEKIHQGAQGSWIKRTLLNAGLRHKAEEVKQGIIRRTGFWDRLVFRRVHKMLGGCMQAVVTGSAPLSMEVLQFARCVFGCFVIEGFGMTETASGITFQVPGETEAGHVGPPLPCNKVKLIDVPEMEYYASEGKGEVCAKGHNIFMGYYKDPEKTAEAIDEDGWLHTGDIGMWLPNGCLKIIDRKKNIFKLAQGEYIAPEKIENVYLQSLIVAQIFVTGDSFKNFPVAVVVPDAESFADWIKVKGHTGKLEELCKNEKVIKLVLDELMRHGKQIGLLGFEQVKAIYLHPELFSISNGMLTPTMKNTRHAMSKYFKKRIEDLYANYSA